MSDVRTALNFICGTPGVDCKRERLANAIAGRLISGSYGASLLKPLDLDVSRFSISSLPKKFFYLHVVTNLFVGWSAIEETDEFPPRNELICFLQLKPIRAD